MRAEPTYATPRSLDRYTDGPAVGAAITRWLGRRPTSWQQALLDVGLERIDGPGTPYAYDEVIGVVGRRCGKTVTAMGVPLARALAGPVTLPNGRRVPFHSVHIAQNLTAARQRFAEDLVEPYRRRFNDETWNRAADFKRAAASTTLTLDPRARSKSWEDAARAGIASELRVLAPTGSSARGAGVLHRTYDEALTYTRIRGEELAAAGRPTMAEMQGHAQTWTVSNIARSTDSKMHMFALREKGRAAVLDDRRDGICYLEFSLPPGEDPEDERAWWRHYPALGDGIVGIRELRRDREELGPVDFTAEYLCRWPDENETGTAGWAAIELESWIAAGVDGSAPDEATAALGVDIDPFGRSAAIVAAVSSGGRTVVECLDHRPGVDWIRDALLALAPEVQSIAVDDYGAGRDLLATLASLPIVADRLAATKAADFGAACFRFDAGLREGRIGYYRTGYVDDLTAAAAAATRTPGRAWQWERRVSVTQAPLVAATLAVWALEQAPASPDPAIY